MFPPDRPATYLLRTVVALLVLCAPPLAFRVVSVVHPILVFTVYRPPPPPHVLHVCASDEDSGVACAATTCPSTTTTSWPAAAARWWCTRTATAYVAPPRTLTGEVSCGYCSCFALLRRGSFFGSRCRASTTIVAKLQCEALSYPSIVVPYCRHDSLEHRYIAVPL